MSDTHTIHTQWNSYYFAIGGFIAGAIYAFVICDLVGLVALASLSTVFILVMLSGLAGAAITGGVAALRNYLAGQGASDH